MLSKLLFGFTCMVHSVVGSPIDGNHGSPPLTPHNPGFVPTEEDMHHASWMSPESQHPGMFESIRSYFTNKPKAITDRWVQCQLDRLKWIAETDADRVAHLKAEERKNTPFGYESSDYGHDTDQQAWVRSVERINENPVDKENRFLELRDLALRFTEVCQENKFVLSPFVTNFITDTYFEGSYEKLDWAHQEFMKMSESERHVKDVTKAKEAIFTIYADCPVLQDYFAEQFLKKFWSEKKPAFDKEFSTWLAKMLPGHEIVPRLVTVPLPDPDAPAIPKAKISLRVQRFDANGHKLQGVPNPQEYWRTVIRDARTHRETRTNWMRFFHLCVIKKLNVLAYTVIYMIDEFFEEDFNLFRREYEYFKRMPNHEAGMADRRVMMNAIFVVYADAPVIQDYFIAQFYPLYWNGKNSYDKSYERWVKERESKGDQFTDIPDDAPVAPEDMELGWDAPEMWRAFEPPQDDEEYITQQMEIAEAVRDRRDEALRFIYLCYLFYVKVTPGVLAYIIDTYFEETPKEFHYAYLAFALRNQQNKGLNDVGLIKRTLFNVIQDCPIVPDVFVNQFTKFPWFKKTGVEGFKKELKENIDAQVENGERDENRKSYILHYLVDADSWVREDADANHNVVTKKGEPVWVNSHGKTRCEVGAQILKQIGLMVLQEKRSWKDMIKVGAGTPNKRDRKITTMKRLKSKYDEL